jgi:uncharacterized protein (TIGR02597 family)
MKANTFAALLSLALIGAGSLRAQTATTDPVGFVSVSVGAASDSRLGVPLRRSAALTSMVATGGVAGDVVTVTATAGECDTAFGTPFQARKHYLISRAGTTEGRWYEVLGRTGNQFTLDRGAATGSSIQVQGLAANEAVQIVPFWTLNLLFPEGAGVDASTDVFSPQGLVMFTNQTSAGTNLPPSRSFIYHPGAQGPEGWYDLDDLGGGLKDDEPITPDTYLVLRNPGGAKTITIVGGVPMEKASTAVVRYQNNVPQDNFVVNPFPIPLTLAQSKLRESGAVSASPDVFSPTDLVLIFNDATSGFNVPPSGAYLYHDGTQGPAGWYDINDLGGGPVDSQQLLQPGRGFIVRKAGGAVQTAFWVADKPY